MKLKHVLLLLVGLALVACHTDGTASNQANEAARPNASPTTNAAAPTTDGEQFVNSSVKDEPTQGIQVCVLCD